MKKEALEIFEFRLKSENNQVSTGNICSYMKEMIRNSNGDSMYLSKVHQIFESTKDLLRDRNRKSENEFTKNDKENLVTAEYRILKAIHGLKHPFCEKLVYQNIDNHLSTNSYFGYTQRNRAYKYFQKVNKPRKGYELFLEIFKKNNSYSNMGKLVSVPPPNF
jgi:hypothetical protein